MAKKTLSTEFRQAIGKVRQIKSDTLFLSTTKKPKPYPKRSSLSIKNSSKKPVDMEIEKLGQEDSIGFIAHGVQKNVLKKLREGHYGLDKSIDLHGLNSQGAKCKLSQFLCFSVKKGYRCVRIIHGKGYQSLDKQPILKNHINVWLRQYEAVLAFCSTPPKDGGTGAIFVLLEWSEKYGKEENP